MFIKTTKLFTVSCSILVLPVYSLRSVELVHNRVLAAPLREISLLIRGLMLVPTLALASLNNHSNSYDDSVRSITRKKQDEHPKVNVESGVHIRHRQTRRKPPSTKQLKMLCNMSRWNIHNPHNRSSVQQGKLIEYNGRQQSSVRCSHQKHSYNWWYLPEREISTISKLKVSWWKSLNKHWPKL